MNRPSVQRARAFTLLEVLIVLGLILLLGGTVFGFLLNVSRSRDRLRVLGEDEQAGSVIIERIEDDLLCGLAGQGGVAGIQGDATRLRVLTRGTWDIPGPGDGGKPLGDVQGSEIAFSAGQVWASRWAGASGSGESEVVSGRIAGCRFRYFGGREWEEEFDSQAAGRLPAAVEVSLWLGSFSEDRSADRRRVVVVPDGPVADWKEGQ